jgi:SAM-dependent methyltransferase
MTTLPHRHDQGNHDWHSTDYVRDWIERDVTEDDTRRPLFRRLLELAPFPSDAELSVLDIGGGYGVVSGVVLAAYPNARVTLQDYSEPMLAQAKARLAEFGGRVRFEACDFIVPGWTAGLGGPFDLAVSGIAIHNLGASGPIAQVYDDVCAVLKPDGLFLNLDFPQFSGGVDTHLGWLRDGGFARAELAWQEGMQHALAAYRV